MTRVIDMVGSWVPVEGDLGDVTKRSNLRGWNLAVPSKMFGEDKSLTKNLGAKRAWARAIGPLNSREEDPLIACNITRGAGASAEYRQDYLPESILLQLLSWEDVHVLLSAGTNNLLVLEFVDLVLR